jgi:hypothetical protein
MKPQPKPLDALIKPAQYKASRGLATMRREAPDHLASSQELARNAACEAARTIQFIAATGLAPSKAKRSIPRGEFGCQALIMILHGSIRWRRPSSAPRAYRMFERWRQENFFKYVREEFLLDALIDYQIEPEDDHQSRAPGLG